VTRLRGRWRVGVPVVVAVAALALVAASPVAADPSPTFPSACSSALDPVSCQRLDYIANETAVLDDDLSVLWWGVWFSAGLLAMILVQPYWDRLFSWWRNPT
jgi:hypothetical protein